MEVEDGLVWRVRESRLTFRTDRGLVGERSDTDSDSDEGPDGGGLSPSATVTVDRLASGVILIPRLTGVFLLRGRAGGVGDCMRIRGQRGVRPACFLREEEERGYKTKGATPTSN
jgi:hypothetical protein